MHPATNFLPVPWSSCFMYPRFWIFFHPHVLWPLRDPWGSSGVWGASPMHGLIYLAWVTLFWRIVVQLSDLGHGLWSQSDPGFPLCVRPGTMIYSFSVCRNSVWCEPHHSLPCGDSGAQLNAFYDSVICGFHGFPDSTQLVDEIRKCMELRNKKECKW
jgi:hypothetical protein